MFYLARKLCSHNMLQKSLYIMYVQVILQRSYAIAHQDNMKAHLLAWKCIVPPNIFVVWVQ